MATADASHPKRQRILQAAIVEIARHGYFDTTVSMIARRAGVADGTIYLYFQSKEEILVSIFDHAMDRFIQEGHRRLPEAAGITLVVRLPRGCRGRTHELVE